MWYNVKVKIAHFLVGMENRSILTRKRVIQCPDPESFASVQVLVSLASERMTKILYMLVFVERIQRYLPLGLRDLLARGEGAKSRSSV